MAAEIVESEEKKLGTRVFKKTSQNGKITTYLGKRDFLSCSNTVELIDGMVLVDKGYIANQTKITIQLFAAFRYGREDLDVLGLTFRKNLVSFVYQVFPKHSETVNRPLTRLQERLKKKLGDNAFPFWFEIPANSPSSVILQPAQGDTGKPCGVDYEICTIVGKDSLEKPKRHKSVRLAIRKLTYSPIIERAQPMIDVSKEFYTSPGGLHLEASLDREMYYHGETISVNVHIQNNSNKTVKKIKVSVVQMAEICIFTTASYSCDVDKIESYEGFPVGPGSTLSKIYTLCPLLQKNKHKRGLALDGQLKHEDTNLASSTIFNSVTQTDRENLGIIVQYKVKIRLFIAGALGGELTAELPFTLTHKRSVELEMSRKSIDTNCIENNLENNKVLNGITIPVDDIDLIKFDNCDEDLVFEDFARIRVKKN